MADRAERVLTERELNRALLARQLLLERGGGSRELAAAARGLRRRFAGREFSRKERDEALSGREPPVSVWRNGVSLWLDLAAPLRR